jgi:hypothetical protein
MKAGELTLLEEKKLFSRVIPPPPPMVAMGASNTQEQRQTAISVHTDVALPNLLRLLLDRLRVQGLPHSKIANAHIYANADKTFFFYVKDGTANTIEDDTAVFPSDNFIAQVRLLLE